MSDLSEHELSNTIGQLSKGLSSEVGNTERVSKHCSKTDTAQAVNEERSTNKSPSRGIL